MDVSICKTEEVPASSILQTLIAHIGSTVYHENLISYRSSRGLLQFARFAATRLRRGMTSLEVSLLQNQQQVSILRDQFYQT